MSTYDTATLIVHPIDCNKIEAEYMQGNNLSREEFEALMEKVAANLDAWRAHTATCNFQCDACQKAIREALFSDADVSYPF